MSDLFLSYKPDAEQALDRMEAWWHGAILDRATIQLTAPKENRRPLPSKHHASYCERWMDVEYQVACADINAANTYWAGDALPSYMPNLGPEILTACYGAELNFTDSTSWSEPILHDWADIAKLKVKTDNTYLRCILDMTRLTTEVGRGKFVTGLTDIHPGADLAASFRDPQQLCVDIISEPGHVMALLEHIGKSFFEFYELNDSIIKASGQTISTSWLPLFVNNQRYYIPSNDFSIMISNEMFCEFFLPELLDEISWLDRSIYHLDGPGALRHLQTLLDIPKLDAIQYVYGDGAKPASRWIGVYQRIQDAGKKLHIAVMPEEIDFFMANLHPEGVMMHTSVATADEADAVLRRVSRWTAKGKY